jgi:DNA repair exonuclease SbcCD ATPase subunit
MAGKGIMNLFFKIEDDGKETQPEKAIPAQPQFATAPVASGITLSGTTPAQEDIAIKQQLSEALEKANQPGYDYFELAQSIQAQAAIIPSEAQRYQSTFAVVAPMGVTPEKLVSSAEFYLSILKKKEEEFNRTVEGHTAEAVTARENDTKKFDADMQAKSEQIKKLTEEINIMQQQKTTIINEISSSRAQIEQVKNNFNATMKVFVDRINSDIGKIKAYLTKTV